MALSLKGVSYFHVDHGLSCIINRVVVNNPPFSLKLHRINTGKWSIFKGFTVGAIAYVAL